MTAPKSSPTSSAPGSPPSGSGVGGSSPCRGYVGAPVVVDEGEPLYQRGFVDGLAACQSDVVAALTEAESVREALARLCSLAGIKPDDLEVWI